MMAERRRCNWCDDKATTRFYSHTGLLGYCCSSLVCLYLVPHDGQYLYRTDGFHPSGPISLWVRDQVESPSLTVIHEALERKGHLYEVGYLPDEDAP